MKIKRKDFNSLIYRLQETVELLNVKINSDEYRTDKEDENLLEDIQQLLDKVERKYDDAFIV